MLCEGWDGDRVGRETQEGEDVCMRVTDSLCGTAETNTTMKSNYTPS